jgi:hypothetical protein
MNKQQKIDILKSTIQWKPDIHLALEKLECKYGIEVGVFVGKGLKNFLKNPFFKEGKFYGVDIYREIKDKPEINDMNWPQAQLDVFYIDRLKTYLFDPNVDIIRGFSKESSTLFPDNYFDFIYLDAAHDYDSVLEDLNCWWSKLKEGGLMSGHDYFPDKRIWRGKEVGVFQAVKTFVEKNNIKVDKNLGCHHMTNMEKEGGLGKACPSFFIIK